MAYLRYDKRCDWYVFAIDTPEGEALAIWHADHRADGPTFSQSQVRDMLARRDYSIIPGYRQWDRELLDTALREWIGELDAGRS